MMASLPTTFDSKSSLRDAHSERSTLPNMACIEPVSIAVIGGTGLSKLDGYEPVAVVNPETPWGYAAAPIHILSHEGTDVAFLARHGLHHEYAPHEVPNRANIAALRHIGVRCVIAFSAVGSLREEIKPMDFVVPDQVIDRTKGVRPFTFFDGGIVGHVGFADPFDAKLAKVVGACAAQLEGDGVVLHEGGTVICMEGPAFSTRAESNMYRSWGGSVIHMSSLPEAKLAREAEMTYQSICMATDYDCWHSSEDVNVEMVMRHMQANGQNAKRLVAGVLDRLAAEEHGDLVQAKHWEGTAQGAVSFLTKPGGRSAEAMSKIEYLFPDIWRREN